MQRLEVTRMWSSRPVTAKARAETTPERYKRRQLERMRRIESHRNRKEHVLLSSTTARSSRPELAPVALLSGTGFRKSPVKSENSQDLSLPCSLNTSCNSDASSLCIKSIAERDLLKNGFTKSHTLYNGTDEKKPPLLMKEITSRSVGNLQHRYQSRGFRKLANPHPRALMPESDRRVDLAVGNPEKINELCCYKAQRHGSMSGLKLPMRGVNSKPSELVRTQSSQSLDTTPPLILKIDKIDVSSESPQPLPRAELTLPITNAVAEKRAIDLKAEERKLSPRCRIRFPRVRWGPQEHHPASQTQRPSDILEFVKPLRRAQSLTHLANPASRGIATDIYGINTGYSGVTHTDDGATALHRPGAAMHRSRATARLELPRALNIEIPYGGNVLLDQDETMSQCSSDRHLSKINMTV